MDENALATNIIGAAIEVHKVLGPGLLESAYQECLEYELGFRGLSYESEVPIPVRYKGKLLCEAYRSDLLIENRVIVELKAQREIADIHRAQLLTYLRLSRKKLGLLINFNTDLLKKGIVRVVNKL
jgi:GxxExxY protein